MNCPACGSPLKERKTNTGVLLLVCSRWPACQIAGTPELLERQRPVERPEPVHVGSFITELAQMKIAMAKLPGKTNQERDAIRQQFLEILK